MKPHEAFGVAVRITGLVILLYLVATSIFLFGAGAPLFFVIRSIVCLLLSIWLIRGAPQLVRFAYPPTEGSKG